MPDPADDPEDDPAEKPRSKLFPLTRADLLAAHAADGDGPALEALTAHVARVYPRPLQAYYRCTTWFEAYGLHEDWLPDRVVQAFLAGKVMHAAYWPGYHQSGKRLHRYLMTGLLLDLQEQYRVWKKHRPRAGGPPEPAHEPEPGHAADRIFTQAMLRFALCDTLAGLTTRGHLLHRRSFVCVDFQGLSIPATATRLGLTTGRVKGQRRVAHRLFRDAMIALLERNGTPPDRVLDEILHLLEILRDGPPRDPPGGPRRRVNAVEPG